MAMQIVPAPTSADHQGQCSARTARGMRTPTGDYMVCAGGHAAGDPHGASFGNAGWFTWTDGSDDTAPLPPAAAVAMRSLDLRLQLPGPIASAVLSYRAAAVRAALLADLAGADFKLSDLEWDDLAHAEDLMAGARAALAQAGRLDLIGVA